MRYIRTLLPAELSKYRDHLLRLSPDDRRLRFGFPISDEGIDTFVDRLRTRGDRVLVHFNPTLEVIGAAQVASTDREAAELAFSVDETERGQGIGRDLFRRGLLWARNRGIRRAHLHFLAENRSMRLLAREAGMEITLEAGECEAVVDLPAPTATTLLTEMTLEAQATGHFLHRANRKLFAPPVLLPGAA